jgi:hypothetical protein
MAVVNPSKIAAKRKAVWPTPHSPPPPFAGPSPSGATEACAIARGVSRRARCGRQSGRAPLVARARAQTLGHLQSSTRTCLVALITLSPSQAKLMELAATRPPPATRPAGPGDAADVWAVS